MIARSQARKRRVIEQGEWKLNGEDMDTNFTNWIGSCGYRWSICTKCDIELSLSLSLFLFDLNTTIEFDRKSLNVE